MTDFEKLINNASREADCLENHFLIAMPHLHDPYFNSTVTYLWKHSADGALGIIVNKPSRMRVTELLHELRLQAKDADIHRELHRERVLTGGPVEKHKGFILHNTGREWDYTLPLTDDISLTLSRDILADIARDEGARGERGLGTPRRVAVPGDGHRAHLPGHLLDLHPRLRRGRTRDGLQTLQLDLRGQGAGARETVLLALLGEQL